MRLRRTLWLRLFSLFVITYTLLWILEKRMTDPLGKSIYRKLLLQRGELTILLLEFNALRLCLGNKKPSAEE